jgi:methionine-rich copper-binding protein CopC
MKLVLALLLLTLAMAPAFMASPAYAQIELVEVDPPDGSELDAPPDVVHLCFSQPVKFRDSASFNFQYLMPDDRALGMRIVFGLGGECVDIFPGLPAVRPEGEYSLEWQVAAAEGDEQGSGTLHFVVGETTTAPASPAPASGETPRPGTPPAGDGPEAAGADDDDGPDILLLALITIAGVGGAAVLFTLGYFVRRRIGYDPHRPPEGDEGGDDH